MRDLCSRLMVLGFVAFGAFGIPAELSAQASGGEAEIAERIDDLAVGLRPDRPWVAPARSSRSQSWRLDSYAPAPAPARVAARRPDRWTFSLAPFFWAPGITGDMTVRGQTAEIDLSIWENLENTIDNFQFAAMLRFEATRCNWSILGGFIYIDVGNEETTGAAVPIDVRWDSTTLIAEAFLGYRFAELPLGCGDACFKPTLALDALAGFRLYHLSADIDLDPGPDASGEKTWVDPVVGLRALFHVTPSLTFNVMGNIGGFGVGSDLSWELIAGVGYDVGCGVSLIAGWVILDIDYESGSFGYDVNMSGPYFGATFRF